MAGCDSCEKKVTEQLQEKDESELTQEEQQILEGEKDVPFAYGPLASVDIEYCRFCFWAGELGSVIFGIVTVWFALGYVPLRPALIAGLFVGGVLTITVGWLGRFPLLGALFGPIVEDLLDLLGIQIAGVGAEESQQEEQGAAALGVSRSKYEYVGDRQPYQVPITGNEVHIVASKAGILECADLNDYGALWRVEVEDGMIARVHPFTMNQNFQRFENVQDHVGIGQRRNLCQGEEQPTTVTQFTELTQSMGAEGIE